MVSELRRHTSEAAFFFPNGVEEHLMELTETAKRVAMLRELTYPSTGEPALEGAERTKALEEESQLVRWLLQDAKPESKKRFGKYLKLT